MNFAEAKERLNALGYRLEKKRENGMLYHTFPEGGVIGHFETLKDVEVYIQRIEEVRKYVEPGYYMSIISI